MSGFLAGLAASTKYNVGLVVIVAVMAWFSIVEWDGVMASWRAAERRNRGGLLAAATRLPTLLLVPVLAIVGLVIATPAVVLDPRLILRYLQLQVTAYGVGTSAGLLPSLGYYLQYLWDTGLGPVACILAALRRSVSWRRAGECTELVRPRVWAVLPPAHV